MLAHPRAAQSNGFGGSHRARRGRTELKLLRYVFGRALRYVLSRTVTVNNAAF